VETTVEKTRMTGDTDAAARETLRLIGRAPPNWVPDRPGIDHNVVLVGGGQSGCAYAWALRRAGIGKVSVIDAAPDEAHAGVWLNAARMNLLRTPKALTGPEIGLPALSFQAWYEARHGRDAYAAIDRIPRTDWAAYLSWYKQFLGIEVRYNTRLDRIEPVGDHFRLHLSTGIETTRKVVLVNGVGGNGGPYYPPSMAGLPASHRAHTADRIDFAALRGRTVAVVGGAASAFDVAGVALEQGAGAVNLFARRDSIASVPIGRSRGYSGAYDNYRSLPDAIRWQQAVRFQRSGSTPTVDAIGRAVAFPNFHLHLSSPWTAARMDGGQIVARAGGTEIRCDFAIAGTGYFQDPNRRAELAGFASEILLWRDRYTPPDGEENDYLGAHPYLGEGHEYLEKTPGAAPFLGNIHVHNPAAFVSFGVPIGDVPSMKRDIPGVSARISRDLFVADLDKHAVRMLSDVAPDFGPEFYATAIGHPGSSA
jgi:cation diffusion facilitator CzcD-associated flavoprotein CzcO